MSIIKYSKLLGEFIEIYTQNDSEAIKLNSYLGSKNIRVCSSRDPKDKVIDWKCAYSKKFCGDRVQIALDIGDGSIYNARYGCSRDAYGDYGILFGVRSLGSSIYSSIRIKRGLRNP